MGLVGIAGIVEVCQRAVSDQSGFAANQKDRAHDFWSVKALPGRKILDIRTPPVTKSRDKRCKF
jgi:hypothetical protein